MIMKGMPETVEIASGTEIIPAVQSSVEEKDIATLNNYADKKFQETTQLSEVMSTMPPILQRGGIYLISAAVGLTSILLYFSKVPIWVEASGSIVAPKTENLLMTAPATGVVMAVAAKTGQRLAKNATLLTIEPTKSQENSVNSTAQNTVALPEAGTIDRLKVSQPGQFVTQGNIVATVIPDRSRLIVESTIGDRDLAAVKPGMMARVKVSAYDFREFGTIPAQVREVTPQLNRPGEFKVVLDLLADKLTQDGEIIALQPGLNVQVEMQTKEKRLLQLLFSQ
jgi:multidrug efflux pump subunit AcrA (membrane-fusion protein)